MEEDGKDKEKSEEDGKEGDKEREIKEREKKG